jgi:DNA-binding transcriptional regulator PaaX
MILTTSGLKLLKKYSFDDINFSQKKKWDGFWRIITFDIPERKAGARKAISSKLRALGCFPLQKSIFVYPYDCRKEVDFIGNYFEARDNICMIEANHIDGEDQIRKYFKL